MCLAWPARQKIALDCGRIDFVGQTFNLLFFFFLVLRRFHKKCFVFTRKESGKKKSFSCIQYING